MRQRLRFYDALFKVDLYDFALIVKHLVCFLLDHFVDGRDDQQLFYSLLGNLVLIEQ